VALGSRLGGNRSTGVERILEYRATCEEIEVAPTRFLHARPLVWPSRCARPVNANATASTNSDEGKAMSGLFSRILAAVDGSEPAKVAAAVAARLAREHDGELILCYGVNWKPLIAQFESIGAVVDPTPTIEAMKERGRRVLAEATEIAARAGIEARCRATAGDPAVTIATLARETASTLIVIGTHDGAGVQRLLVGSVTTALLRRSSIPVLTVRPGIGLADESHRCFERVLVATDGAQRSAGAIDAALALPPEDRRKLIFCSVAEAGTASAAEAPGAVAGALAKAQARAIPAEGRVVSGASPSAAITAAAQREHADLIVLGTHSAGEIDRVALGSVAERIVRTAPLPVLIVRTAAAPGCETNGMPRHEASLV
jgi:nucleotide-binding universal stress UspA family protein